MIEADLAERYCVDFEDDHLLRRRSWRWLKARISGLLAIPPSVAFGPDGTVVTIHQSRVMNTLFPPREERPDGS